MIPSTFYFFTFLFQVIFQTVDKNKWSKYITVATYKYFNFHVSLISSIYRVIIPHYWSDRYGILHQFSAETKSRWALECQVVSLMSSLTSCLKFILPCLCYEPEWRGRSGLYIKCAKLYPCMYALYVELKNTVNFSKVFRYSFLISN